MGAKFNRHYKQCYHITRIIIVKFKTLDTIKILLLLNALEIQKEGNPIGLSAAKVSAKMQFGKMPFNFQEKILPEVWTSNSVQTNCLNRLYSLLGDDA